MGRRADRGARLTAESATTGSGDRLGAAFFDRPVLDVAPALLGCLISHDGVTVRLTEVEAYNGATDPGSHAFRGQTPRTSVMFGPPGSLYVYFTYGMHYCANLVCGPDGTAAAVLLRAGAVVRGAELARARRTAPSPGRRSALPVVSDRDLARGPARLTRALALTGADNGTRTDAPTSRVVLTGPPTAGTSADAVRTGPRVGVSGPGGDALAYPWRFWIADEPTVSSYRPGRPPRSRAGRA